MLSAAVEIGRDHARDLARIELSKPQYRRDEPSLVQRALSAVLRELGRLLSAVAGHGPGGWLALVVLVVAVAGAVALVLRGSGGVRRSSRSGEPLLGARTRSAAEHRAAADAAATAGDHATAVRERLRATARDLEERGLLDVRPGRTADELVADAGRVLPDVDSALGAAARVFDDVWYGGRTATAEDYAVVSAADELVRTARVRTTALA